MEKGLSGMQKMGIIIVAILVLGGLIAFWIIRSDDDGDETTVDNFASCVAAGYPVMESFPRQCAVPDGQTFTEVIDTTEEQTDTAPPVLQSDKGVEIILTNPVANTTITSPLEIRGEVPGSWSFEGSFSIVLTDWDGVIIARTTATLDGDWMTDERVPFTAELTFEKPAVGDSGSLVLQRDNASGLSENDDALEITVQF